MEPAGGKDLCQGDLDLAGISVANLKSLVCLPSRSALFIVVTL